MSEREMGYLPLCFSAAATAQRHARSDWPNLCPIEPSLLRLVWVPFDGATGANLGEATGTPQLEELRLPATHLSAASLGAAPADAHALALRSPTGARIVYAPLWVLSSTQPGDFAIYSGHTGEALAGELGVDQSAARIQLFFCMFLSLFCTLIGGGFLFVLIGAAIALCRFAFAFSDLAVGPLVGLLVSLTAIGWYFIRVRSLLPRLFRAPLRRVISGRVSLPFDTSWLVLVKAAGMIVSVQLPLLAASGWMGEAATSPVVIALVCAQFLCGLGFAWTALSRSHRAAVGHDEAVPSEPREPAADLVSTTLRVAIFSLCGGLAAGALSVCGIAEVWQVPQIPGPAVAMAAGADVFALMALVLAQASVRARLVLAVSMLARSLAALWLGPWLGLATTVCAVALTLWGFAPRVQGATHRPSATAMRAVRESWYFNLVATGGRLVGHSLAVFFFGFTAAAIGEIVGERIAGTAAFLSRADRGPL